jgi:hypothetical protein
MPRCDLCGNPTILPFHCQYCGGSFCDEHRLPPNHQCAGIGAWRKKPTPGVGIQYSRGGGATPARGGYITRPEKRPAGRPWHTFPYLKVAIAAIVIIVLLLLYLGLTGFRL